MSHFSEKLKNKGFFEVDIFIGLILGDVAFPKSGEG